jgi:hypothetical protein
LALAQVGDEWSVSRSCRYTPWGKAPITHSIEGWVGRRTVLVAVEKSKFFILPGLELDPSAVQPVTSRYADCTIPVPANNIVSNKNVWDWRLIRWILNDIFPPAEILYYLLMSQDYATWLRREDGKLPFPEEVE